MSDLQRKRPLRQSDSSADLGPRPTGQTPSVGYFPVGSAEILARDDEPSEFGLPEGWPHDYCGKTPQGERIIGVGKSY